MNPSPPSSYPTKATTATRGPTRRHRVVPFLVFFLLKALCSLVVLNFYIGAQISLEDHIAMAMHLDRGTRVSGRSNFTRSRNGTVAGRPPRNVVAGANGTTSRDRQVGARARHNVVSGAMIVPSLADGTLQGKERLWRILRSRNATQRVEAAYWDSIPTWDTILNNIGDGAGGAGPIILGLETCSAFRNATAGAPSQRRVAPAGLFNTGTNYLSVLLDYNCQNPERVAKFHGNAKRGHGNEWEVPWGKHSPALARGKYFKNKNLNYAVDEVLPVVLVRNPYGWMKSMCRNPYTARWDGMHGRSCPAGNDAAVQVAYGSGTTRHRSLGHLWNDWYGEYFYNGTADDHGGATRPEGAPFPRLIIRFEDIIFFPYEVTKQVCACAGGVLGHRADDADVAAGEFHYVVRSAKTGGGHGPASQRNGLIDSWARYGGEDPRDAYSEEEVRAAQDALDPKIMRAFGYR